MKSYHKNLPEISLTFYWISLACFTLLTAFVSPWLAALELLALVVLFLYSRRTRQQQKGELEEYLQNMTASLTADLTANMAAGINTAARSMMQEAPIPLLTFRTDSRTILWSNEAFHQMVSGFPSLFELPLEEVVPQLDTEWLLDGKRESPNPVILGDRSYRVFGFLPRRTQGKQKGQAFLATTYWLDVTELQALQKKYERSRLILALVMIDNYEELMKSGTEASRSNLLAKINEHLSSWIDETHGILQKYTRERYLVLLQEEDYQSWQKFPILDTVRTVVSMDGIAATLSIGVGRGGDTLEELYTQATVAMDMALSRGGDQAVVKDKNGFSFYGGRTTSSEKPTKVKSRVMANILGELIDEVEQVFIMGHQCADMDALGAAVGLCCAVRSRGKKPYIVLDPEKNLVQAMWQSLKTVPAYQEVFLTGQEAFIKARSSDLVVVVDTNRSYSVESPPLLEACKRVAVIDHHRRSTDYIDNTALNFHDTYASSACEMVTELLQYLLPNNSNELLRIEAEALLGGIVLDTKNLTIKTRGRTFEAAAFLRRAGADPVAVQRLFLGDWEELKLRQELIRTAEIVADGILLITAEQPLSRETAGKIVDELLLLKNMRSSFILYPCDGGVLCSARSVGEVNVQVILEQIGGGGTPAMAGGQFADTTVSQERERLLSVIQQYLQS